MEKSVRIDKWLWAARFFKTRSIASKAVSGGKVHLNGQRVKPARMISVNDQLVISKDQMEYNITVLGLSEKRGPAKVAQLLYEESEESIKTRLEQRELRRMSFAGYRPPGGRPTKRDRRKIREFIKKEE